MMDGSKGFDDALTGEQKIRNFNINFGPQHPAVHGVLRLVLDVCLALPFSSTTLLLLQLHYFH